MSGTASGTGETLRENEHDIIKAPRKDMLQKLSESGPDLVLGEQR